MVSSRWFRVEFTAFDGVCLRGNLYRTTTSNAPVVIMTQGLALLKEHYLNNWAERFQDAGFNVLTYDHRNFGHSEGLPRNEVNLQLQADDYSDAVTFAQSLDDVNEDKIFLWGIGHSGGAAGIAAAFDRRIAGVILVMPSQSGKYDYDNWPSDLRDRYTATRSAGKEASLAKADFWRFWPVSEADRAGEGEAMLQDDTSYNWAQGAFRLTDEGGNTFDNKVAISSLHSIFRARPGVYFTEISPTPVLFLAATDDPVATDYDTQVKTFQTLSEPKEFVTLNGGHLANYFGKQFDIGAQAMVTWLNKYSQ